MLKCHRFSYKGQMFSYAVNKKKSVNNNPNNQTSLKIVKGQLVNL